MGNQYVQLVFHGDDAFVHIYPATDGGKNLTISDVTEYLSRKSFSSYQIKELNDALNAPEEQEVRVGEWDKVPVDEEMDIHITMDKMKAICRFYPPSENGRRLDVKGIIGELVANHVRFGIDQNVIYECMTNHHYCTDYVFARGRKPRHGTDAQIEYYFNTDINLQPKRNEDGSVDYKELNTISHVTEGQLLARLIPEDPGVSGQNIYGEELKPRAVKTSTLQFGNNITINEEKTEIYSDVTGHASLVEGKVFVSNIYEVGADVDNSVGNIVYNGSVVVKGNVKAGFSIRADGDVIVDGVVENAYIEAGGQIICKRGIHGVHKGTLKAGSNIIAKYIENATILAGGYVEAEIILNSDVSAAASIRLHGKKGLANGGTLRAGNSIEAEHVGTEMGTITVLEVGIEPARKVRYIDLQKQLKEITQELDGMKVIIDNYMKKIEKGVRLPADKMRYVKQLSDSYAQKGQQLNPIQEEMKRIHEEMMEADNSYVLVNRKAYPGVTVSISDLSFQVKDVIKYSKFKKKDGEIRAIPL